MKQKFITAHMKVAEIYSELSSAKKMKVGSVIVKDDRIISIGYNGMPSGWDNDCEEPIYPSVDCVEVAEYENLEGLFPFVDEQGKVCNYKTKDEVLHAESNAIAKLAKSSESGKDATMFSTHSPCIQCAKLIHQSGIKEVFYRHDYRDKKGVEFLRKCGVKVEKV